MLANINNRKIKLITICFFTAFLLFIIISGPFLEEAAMKTDFSQKDLPPSLRYPFGTDWLGRNMLARTVAGLSTSILLGALTTVVSGIVAFTLGAAAAMGKGANSAISFIIDLIMGIPHILLLILISFACGTGATGIIIGIILTHWMSLARVMRSEILQLKESGFIKVAHKLGTSKIKIVTGHMLPHLIPQFAAGLILLFPHAILHEASITFLGFGLSPEQPAIGIILSESMRYLITGNWWLAVLPGGLLVAVVMIFDYIGRGVRALLTPTLSQE